MIRKTLRKLCVGSQPTRLMKLSEDRSRAPFGWQTRFNVQVVICAVTVTLRCAAVWGRPFNYKARGQHSNVRAKICPCNASSISAGHTPQGHHVVTTNIIFE